jgi:rubredoxin
MRQYLQGEVVHCPACHAAQADFEAMLGALGALAYYRCRYCGWQWTPGPVRESEHESPNE